MKRVAQELMAAIFVALIFNTSVAAQSQGNNAVYNGSGGVTGSSAFIDASSFCPTGGCTTTTDFCGILNKALTSGSPPASGVVVDARGVIQPLSQIVYPGSLSCSTNPFVNVSIPSTVLLPSLNINILVPWIMPDHTRIIGTGRNTDILAMNFTPDTTNSMIEMGYYGQPAPGWSPCPNNNICTGVSIEHLKLTGSATLNGIYNANSQDGSYVDDVDLYQIGGIGLTVAGPSTAATGAVNSGPYSNLNYAAYSDSTCSSNQCPACFLIQVQTRGLHDLTCIGTTDSTQITANSPGHAGIYINASNNTIEDVHIEGFWDGIQIGGSNAIGNVLVSNIGGFYGGRAGPTTNAVHVCGPHSRENIGNCTGSVSDVTLLQINGDAKGGKCTATVLDDQTSTAVGPANTTIEFLGFYGLGEEVGGSAGQFSRFVTNPSSSQSSACTYSGGSYNLTITPTSTWSVGGGAPNGVCTPGALYSNTSGGAGQSVYVCTSASAWAPIA